MPRKGTMEMGNYAFLVWEQLQPWKLFAMRLWVWHWKLPLKNHSLDWQKAISSQGSSTQRSRKMASFSIADFSFLKLFLRCHLKLSNIWKEQSRFGVPSVLRQSLVGSNSGTELWGLQTSAESSSNMSRQRDSRQKVRLGRWLSRICCTSTRIRGPQHT